MIRQSRFLNLVCCIAILATLLAGCGTDGGSTSTDVPSPAGAASQAPEEVAAEPEAPTGDAGSAKAGGTLVVAYPDLQDTFNPVMATHMKPWPSGALFDNLVLQDFEGKLVPGGLTKYWEVSDDGLVYTFHLKEGIKFHDGTPFTSEAVRFYIEEMRKGPSAYMYDQVREVQTPDDHTAVFQLTQPFPNLLWNLSTTYNGIFSPQAYQEAGEDYGTEVVVGTGPYKMVEFVADDHITLERNPDYTWGPDWLPHQGPAYPDTLILRAVPEDSTRLFMLESGDVDIVMMLPPQYVQEIEAKPDLRISQGLDTRITYVGMNTARWPFDDVRVRQAVAQAVDRDAIISSLAFGAAVPAYSYLAAPLEETKGEEEYGYKYNPEASRAALAEAGWADSDGDGIVEKDGKPLQIRLHAQSVTEYQRLAEAVQAYLKDIGIAAEIILVDQLKPVQESGDWEAFVAYSSWGNADILEWWFNADLRPYPNMFGWNDPKTQEMLAATVSAKTWEERVEAYSALNQYLTEQAIWAPLYTPYHNVGLSSRVQGYRQNVLNAMIEVLPVWLQD